MKDKTRAAWLAFLGGPLGVHRFYLHGRGDPLGWLLPLPTALGLYGLRRMLDLGPNDPLGGLLVTLLGFSIAGGALTSIVYGLMPAAKWNARFNPGAASDAPAGRTHWLTIGALVMALMVGATVLMSSLALGFQRYFEWDTGTAFGAAVPSKTASG